VRCRTTCMYVCTYAQNYRQTDGTFEFKIQWPGLSSSFNHWKQTSNPFAGQAVAGYQGISISYTDQYWGGLEYNGSPCVADGSVNHGNWFYAIGSAWDWGGGMPAWTPAASQTELYIRAYGAQWRLVFRQSAGTYYSVSQWLAGINTNDPTNDNYSILNNHANWRGSNSLFRFKINWPGLSNSANEWYQSSDPFAGQAVAGYQGISISYTDQYWGGLEYNGSPCVADGSVNIGNWYYAIGSVYDWGGGMPAWTPAASRTELWVYY
jgi:hypothetical protein